MKRLLLASCMTFSLSLGCSADGGSSSTEQDLGGTDQGAADLGQTTEDMTMTEADASPDLSPDMTVAPVYPDKAADYCEGTADLFCDYYLRCGRIAAADMADCQATFLETCNGVYEPVYEAYETAGMLELSPEGIAECATHLSELECSTQLFDLDGPCSNVWQGQVAAGGACAPGIGSFVCDAQSVCKLDLSLCGTCEPAVAVGEACDDTTSCFNDARCVDNVCVARGLPGQACHPEAGCIVGSFCVDSVCQGRSMAAVGEMCDGTFRCPYKSTCIGGTCVESALQGESCADVACASGYCDVNSVCQPLRDFQAGCSEDGQCASGSCNGPICGPLLPACFD